MSSLMNVESMTWILIAGWAARTASMIGRIGARSSITWGFSPGIRPTIRTADPSAEVSSAAGGAVNGSMSSSNVGVETPATGAFAARRVVMRSATVARRAGSVAAPGSPARTTTKRSKGGVFVAPAALKTS